MDITKETKTSLAARLESLTAERDMAQQATNNLLVVANAFHASLANIDAITTAAPISKGLFKKFWWVITNWRILVQLIEDIIVQVNNWKNYVESLRQQQEAVPA